MNEQILTFQFLDEEVSNNHSIGKHTNATISSQGHKHRRATYFISLQCFTTK